MGCERCINFRTQYCMFPEDPDDNLVLEDYSQYCPYFEEEEETFYCPVRGCSYKTKSLGALKVHFRRFHADLKYYCPICKKRVKTAHHSKYFNDDKHLVLYYLTRHNTSWNNKTELVKRARDVAYKRLRSGNFKF